MRAMGCAFLLGFLSLIAPLGAKAGDDHAPAWQAKESAAIEKTVQGYMDSWNKHDLQAVLIWQTEDTDFTNAFGNHYHGRAEMEKTFAPMLAGVYSETHQTGKIRSIRFFGRDVASVDIDWEMTGAKNPDGSMRPTRRGLHNCLMTRQKDGRWLIAVMHVTEFTNTPPLTPQTTAR